jgi:putative transposase
VIGADRSSVRDRSRRPEDGLLRLRLREIAALRRRFGYHRLHILRQRIAVNRKNLCRKNLCRLYVENGFRFTVAPLASGRSASGRRWPCHKAQISAG